VPGSATLPKKPEAQIVHAETDDWPVAELVGVMPGGHAVQLSADCAEYCPAAHGVHICGLPRTVPESTEASSLPPRATYEPALHGPAHALVP
jgi:hypothetical protein